MLLHTAGGGVFLQPTRKKAILSVRQPGPQISFFRQIRHSPMETIAP
jgi:hypothetical protein